MSTEKVIFESQGLNVAGMLYLPENAEGPVPGIVIGHPVTSVKEQSPANYAQAFADAGFAALAFDASYQGESAGLPRQLEDPWVRSEDVKNAVSFLTVRPEIDSDRIGAFGICGSGAYVPFAAQTDHRIRAVATASAANLGDLLRADPDTLKQQIELSNQARTDALAGPADEPVDLLPTTREQAEQFPEGTMFREAYDYYKTDRAAHENAPGTLAAESFDRIANWDGFQFMSMISPRPLLMVVGSAADTIAHSERAISLAEEPKELFTVEGATHVDLYDKRVDDVVAKVVPFFQENL